MFIIENLNNIENYRENIELHTVQHAEIMLLFPMTQFHH